MENAGLALPSALMSVLPSSLLELARQTPPMPSAVLIMTTNANEFKAFRELVYRYVPEHAEKVLEHKTAPKQIQQFAIWFSRAYFHLADYIIAYFDEMEMNRETMDHSDWGYFLERVPLELNAIEYEELHELWEHYDGAVTHLALLAGWSDMYSQGTNSVHTSWVETALASSVPPELIARIPEGGIHPAVLREALTGTQEEDAMHLIEWIIRGTDNTFMDYSNDEFHEGMIHVEWDEESVAFLTAEWKTAQEIQGAIGRTIDRMRDSPVTGLDQVLDFTLARMETMDMESVIERWGNRHMNSETPEEGQEEDNDNHEQ